MQTTSAAQLATSLPTANNLVKPVPPIPVPAPASTPAPASIPTSASPSETKPAKVAMPKMPTPILAPAEKKIIASTPATTVKPSVPSKKTTAKPPKPKKPGQKQIPTILGLLILIGSLLAGVLLFGNGTGVFAPRATPETTPQNVQISNVTDKSFTVSFFTDEASVGYVKYGTSADDIKKQASDDRDQLSGVVKPYRLHQVTVRGLTPNTTYYYLLGTGNKATYDNSGVAYQIKTASSPGSVSPNNQTIYGTVSQAGGGAAEGAIVYVNIDGVGPLSTLVKSSGSWAISLSNAFDLNLSAYPLISEDSQMLIKVQDINPSQVAEQVVTVANAQPTTEIVLGGMAAAPADPGAVREELLAIEPAETATDSAAATSSAGLANLDLEQNSADIATDSTDLSNEAASNSSALAKLSQEERTLDLSSLDETTPASATVIQTTQPVLEAKLPANVTVKIEIHSDTAISQTVQTDADGNLSLDVASLGQNLEPGEHTATYSYIDPSTGEEVIKSYTFTVADDATGYGMGADDENNETEQLASATTTNNLATSSTYGSGNPYVPTASTTPSLTASPSASPTPIMTSSESARTTTVSTASGTYNSGSTLNTLALLFAGGFFLVTGLWSFFLARQFKKSHD